jgi:hypothetical protein
MTDRTAFNSIYARLTDDIVDNVDNVKTAHLRSDEPTTCRRDNVNIVNNVRVSKTLSSPLTSAFSAIERQCSDLVSAADWQRAVEDGRLFIVQWGERAEALGWTAQDLFGLHDPPEQHGPNYRRLSRYDVTGLIWLLHGRPVVALTADRAVIGTAGGGVTFYRMATQNYRKAW